MNFIHFHLWTQKPIKPKIKQFSMVPSADNMIYLQVKCPLKRYHLRSMHSVSHESTNIKHRYLLQSWNCVQHWAQRVESTRQFAQKIGFQRCIRGCIPYRKNSPRLQNNATAKRRNKQRSVCWYKSSRLKISHNLYHRDFNCFGCRYLSIL